MLNAGKMHDLIEMYVGHDLNPKLTREIFNLKLREFSARTGVLESSSTISSVADTQEYELPIDAIHIKDVIYDGYRAHKIQFWQVKAIQGKA